MSACDELAAPPPPPLSPVDLADPAARARWLFDVRNRLADITTAALEATGPKRHRVLSRAEARRMIQDASAVLITQLDAAEAPRATTAAEPDDARVMDDAWRDVIGGLEPSDDSIAAVLFAALVGGPYEGAEMDPPSVAVLRAVRATVDGWAHARGGSTMLAAVPFVDLELLARRLDVAIMLVKRSPGGVR